MQDPGSFTCDDSGDEFECRESSEGLHECVQCGLCGAKFKKISLLKSHFKTIHPNAGPYECVHCGAEFQVKSNLKKHLLIHSAEKPHECVECGAKFKLKSYLNSHLRNTHTNARPCKCVLCGASFKDKKALKRHLLVHSGERPYECEECGARFKQISHLNNHLKNIHNNTRSYECVHYGAEFKEKSNLKRDLVTHSIERPHENHCRNRLYQQDQIFDPEGPYCCVKCALPFESKEAITEHFEIACFKQLLFNFKKE